MFRSEAATDAPTLREDGGIIDLAIDRLAVDNGCIEQGKVTLSAKGADPVDAYGYEFDLEPEAARLLARQLVDAAHAADLAVQDRGVDTRADNGSMTTEKGVVSA